MVAAGNDVQPRTRRASETSLRARQVVGMGYTRDGSYVQAKGWAGGDWPMNGSQRKKKTINRRSQLQITG